MKPAPFAYHDPRSVDEVVALLAAHGEDAKLLAGGQSLMPMLALRLARPAVIVDINRVSGLDGLRLDAGTLAVGALVRQRALERRAAASVPLVAAVLGRVGHLAIRTRGTVVGSLAHADPAAEIPALAVCLDGVVDVRSARGSRTLAIRELLVGPLTTALAPDEVIVETRWQLPVPGAGWGFHEVARRHGDFALVGAIAVVALVDGRIGSVRIALFAAGPTPVRATAAEEVLTGATAAPAALTEAARLAADAVDPDSDLHATAAYRRRVARTLTERALADAVARAAERP